MNHRVILTAEHKWRDLPGLVWLKILLEQKNPGWEVAIMSKNSLNQFTKIFAPSVIVIPSSEGSWPDYAKGLSRQGVLTVILPVEGRPTYGKLMDYCITNRDNFQAEANLLWNKIMAQIFDQSSKPNAKARFVVGPTRFDFYRPPLSRLLMKKEELAKYLKVKINGPVVSWATSFPEARIKNKSKKIKAQISGWLDMGFGKLGLKEHDLEQMIERDFKAREASVACLEKCARTYPEAHFCLKPHPFEDFNYYQQKIASWKKQGINNVSLIRGLYIWDLLNVTSVHLHRSCTTGTEAWLLDKPTIELGFIKLYEEMLEAGGKNVGSAKDAENAEDIARTMEAVVEKVGAYLKGKPVDPELKRKRAAYIEKWFDRVDGNATQRAVDHITELVKQHQPKAAKGSGLSDLTIFGTPFYKIYQRIIDLGAPRIDRWGNWDRYARQKDTALWEKRIKAMT